MSLMTIRHKPIRLFVWLTCFLTFYLGFNQQVMCFELSPDGGINKLHLQLIECNPLSSYVNPSNHSTDMPMSGIMTVGQSGNGCPDCRDFHLSFKRTPSNDFSSIGALVTFLPVDSPITAYKSLATHYPIRGKIPWAPQFLNLKSNSSLVALRTTILLI